MVAPTGVPGLDQFLLPGGLPMGTCMWIEGDMCDYGYRISRMFFSRCIIDESPAFYISYERINREESAEILRLFPAPGEPERKKEVREITSGPCGSKISWRYRNLSKIEEIATWKGDLHDYLGAKKGETILEQMEYLERCNLEDLYQRIQKKARKVGMSRIVVVDFLGTWRWDFLEPDASLSELKGFMQDIQILTKEEKCVVSLHLSNVWREYPIHQQIKSIMDYYSDISIYTSGKKPWEENVPFLIRLPYPIRISYNERYVPKWEYLEGKQEGKKMILKIYNPNDV